MTRRTHLDVQFGGPDGGARCERVAAAARNLDFLVARMNISLHNALDVWPALLRRYEPRPKAGGTLMERAQY